MFLDVLLRRNPEFIRAAVALHREGRVPANTYLLDLDAMETNARVLADAAKQHGLRVYAMTKQLGRNPRAIAALARGGIDAGVAVDMACARGLHTAGATVGHLGHLVQVPRHEAREAAAMRPEHWTVFSEAKAQEASGAAEQAGTEVGLLARVHAPGDTFYPGHEGGFDADDAVAVAERIEALPAVRFAGITSFPALLFDQRRNAVRPTPNLATLGRVAAQLRAAGHADVEINAPGTTSAATLSTLADAGATQVEPGHGLTGTTPWHAVEDLAEEPAMLYLTEVSHRHVDRSYCFGGGLYIDPVFDPYQVTALVGADPDAILERRVDAVIPPPAAIDYYGQLECRADPGDTVVFGFRAQAFVTRANVVPVAGVRSGRPQVEGIWGPDGRPVLGGKDER